MSSESAHLDSRKDSGHLRARVAIDLGAESCRVSLLRWQHGMPRVELVHRIPNGPVRRGQGLFWPLEQIMAGVEEGLRKAAVSAPEGVASIGVDGWAVDYVRLDDSELPLDLPRCYRDPRTIAAKKSVDAIASPEWLFSKTGAQPLRINTLYQLVADQAAGVHAHRPWLCIPEYVLYRLGGSPVAEYTNATHTGLVDLQTGDWSDEVLQRVGISRDSLPRIVASGTVVGKLQGPLSRLPALRDAQLIVPACHDTASAIAGIPSDLSETVYLCSGTWSLIGTLIEDPIQARPALAAGFTNQGAAGSGICFHCNVNGMWIVKQCLDSWNKAGRSLNIEDLIARATICPPSARFIDVSDPSLLLDGDMPAMLNEQLRLTDQGVIPDEPGNEGLFAQVIFKSLAHQYAKTIRSLKSLTKKDFSSIHILGGGSLNRLLTRLTAEESELPVECGQVESSTIGNFAVQLASSQAHEEPVARSAIVGWAQRLLCP